MVPGSPVPGSEMTGSPKFRFQYEYFPFIFPSFKTTHTTLFWFLGDTQGARFYDKHGTTLHLFVILFPVQYMEKRFALETRESFLIKISEIQKPARVEEKRRGKYFF